MALCLAFILWAVLFGVPMAGKGAAGSRVMSARSRALDTGGSLMDAEFVLAGSLEELKPKRRLVAHGGHHPILVIYHCGGVFALDNRCRTWASHSSAAASTTAS